MSATPQQAADVLHEAAEAINVRDADTIRSEAGDPMEVFKTGGPATVVEVILWLRARADRIAGGGAS